MHRRVDTRLKIDDGCLIFPDGHCTEQNPLLTLPYGTEYREHVKDLSCISKDPCRVVIVDNNPFSFLLQPLNGFPCIPFSAGQPRDEQLLEVILPLLKHLSRQKDNRFPAEEDVDSQLKKKSIPEILGFTEHSQLRRRRRHGFPAKKTPKILDFTLSPS
ncbi:unnamed protein product [Fraxinus pennsylvanica]|uniref:Mitochondrial import inner membrane translocase subunit TIM50 n=1 Tax=Fraxinus pennsylvanica TaxID=56036 RepID=A0AAD1Z4Q7_9LAMI|nr:unnamed protein product [Fraxinus pennsylvanica]